MNAEERRRAIETIAHVPPLVTLAEKVRPAHTAVVVIDVQNDFCAEGGMMDQEGRDLSAPQEMAARMPGFVEAARSAGVLPVFVRNVYSSEANLYLSDSWLEQATRRRGDSYTKRPICEEGSWGGRYYGRLSPAPGDVVVTKHRFSAFHNTDLETILRAHGVRTVVLCGVTSNVCVETTAREAFMRDFYVVFTSDGSAAYSEAEHRATLEVIDRFFGQVASLDEVEAAWAGQVPATSPELA